MLFELICVVLTKSVTNTFAKLLTHVLGSPAVVQCAVCSMHCAMCSVQYAVCACLLRSGREISKKERAVLHFERTENIIFSQP